MANSISIVAALVMAWLVVLACAPPGTDTEVCPSGRRCPPGWGCAAAQDICIQGTCGNGMIDVTVGEECDDGNTSSEDGCTAECKQAVCGDGYVREDLEFCDPGVPDSACRPDCLGTVMCGNRILDADEECDDGNSKNDDICVAGCKLARCGDGHTWTGVEACDRGQESSPPCRPDCQGTIACGNGVIDPGELCDDGNTEDDDACPSGTPSGASDQRPRCVPARCGDNFLWAAGGEACDDGNTDNNDSCAECQPAVCGDGYIRLGNEECDDGTESNEDACLDGPNGGCTPARCGDGHVFIGEEECDGNARCNGESCCGYGLCNDNCSCQAK